MQAFQVRPARALKPAAPRSRSPRRRSTAAGNSSGEGPIQAGVAIRCLSGTETDTTGINPVARLAGALRLLRQRLVGERQPQRRFEKPKLQLLLLDIDGVIDEQERLIELAVVEDDLAAALVQHGQPEFLPLSVRPQ